MFSLLVGVLVAQLDASVPLDPPEVADGGVSDVLVSETRSVSQLVAGDAAPAADVFHVRFRLGFLTEWGNHPSSPLGLVLSARLGTEHWGGVIEAWGLLPESIGDVTGTGSLSVYSFGGVAGGCYESAVLSGTLVGCVLGRGGVMRFDPRNVPDLTGQWQPTVAAGARAGGEWPRQSFIAFFVTAHAFVPIIKPYLRGENVGWTQSWVFGGAQIGFRVRWR